LEIDPRNTNALGFLGMVYHLLGDVEAAIVKYHETLSIDPINGHIIELLNLALTASAAAGPFGFKGFPGGEEDWARKMREHRDKGKSKQIAGRNVVQDMPQSAPPVDEEMNVG